MGVLRTFEQSCKSVADASQKRFNETHITVHDQKRRNIYE